MTSPRTDVERTQRNSPDESCRPAREFSWFRCVAAMDMHMSSRRIALLGAVLFAALAAAAAAPSASHAAGECNVPITNQVACENTKPGADPSTWQIDGAGDPTIQGFATQMSVNKGETIAFKIKSATPNYRIDILRLGYYGGDGARLIEGEPRADRHRRRSPRARRSRPPA